MRYWELQAIWNRVAVLVAQRGKLPRWIQDLEDLPNDTDFDAALAEKYIAARGYYQRPS